MKTVTLIFLAVMLVLSGCTGCKQVVDANGLPPATQEGKNTLGFLLNGKPWMPKGFVGLHPNLSLSLGGVWFNISAYNISSERRQYFLVTLDSLQKEGVYMLTSNSNLIVNFSDSICYMNSSDTDVYRKGNLTITKLDKINGIFAGTFSATLYKQGCGDTIRITEGRFDLKQN